ncbi:MAG: tRNA uridine-5-carboxymethylaminomethyl(34) synthesis GTPase MnmE [Clostridia bacterium]|nr:tRNA uridine-5-carboxymethylaminomethyl(34) synthesis GTPase MnmE [Clostridia bacterium]
MSTIAAISTAHGIGGIGVIRISGENAAKIADKVFVPFVGEKENCLQNLPGYRAKYGKIIHEKEYIDDAVVLVFKAPNSYTGEDVVEISCHGGLYVTKRVLRAVLEAGADPAEPGEFTKRAFLNGKMDLSQAEAVMDLINAKGKRANQIAFKMREGSSSKKINEIKEKLIDISAGLSVWADYPEDDIPEVDEKTLRESVNKIIFELDNIIKNYDTFKAIKEGVKTAIIGRPNVGKSTLMNLLSDSKKSIVTDIPGTTRDAIEENIMIGDIPVLLVDTAGIRSTEDKVEKIGVEKAKEHMKDAEIVLFMIDASNEFSNDDKELLKVLDKEKTIVLLNKCDINKKVKKEELSTFSGKIVELSALQGSGIEKLKDIIEEFVGLSKFDPSDSVISNERQLLDLKKAKETLHDIIKEIDFGVTLDAITVLFQDVLKFFMEFTGENVSEAVVNRVFSKFCVGK